MTTGRINQVAILRDAAPRPAPGTPWASRVGPGTAVVRSGNRCFSSAVRGHTPAGIIYAASERTTRPRGPSPPAQRLRWNARVASASSDTPREASDGRVTRQGNDPLSTGQQHKEIPSPTEPAGGKVRDGQDIRSTVRSSSTEPVNTGNKYTTHTPALTPSQRHRTNHTPREQGRTSKWKHRVAPLQRC